MNDVLIELLKNIEYMQRECVIFTEKDEVQIKLLCRIIIDNFELTK